jgi:hypothetical protein
MPELTYPVESVAIETLKSHPKNYKKHPVKQLEHLMKSIEEHGFYRNVIIAKDSTILAGHGVVQASLRLKLTTIPVIRLNIDPTSPAALKVLAGDNEISHLGEVNQEALMEILGDLRDADELFGSGWDAEAVDGLFQDKHSAEFAESQWTGLPSFEMEDTLPVRRVIVNLETEEDAQKFSEKLGVEFTQKTISIWYPPKARRDNKSTSYEDE